MKPTIKSMCALGLATMSLSLIAGCSTTTDTTVPTVSESEAQAELNQYGNNNGGYCNLDDSAKTYSNGTVSITVTGKEHVVSLADAKKIFSATVDGKTYNFPCAVNKVTGDGWMYSDSNMFRVSKMEKERKFKYTYGENQVVFYKGSVDDAYGCAQDEIYLNIANAYNSEPTYWEDCTCLGMAFYATDEDRQANLAGMADFQTGIGINVGDSIEKVEELFGQWKYHDDTLDKESDLFGIYVNVNGTNECVGYVNFYQQDGTIVYVNIKVNVNKVSVLDK